MTRDTENTMAGTQVSVLIVNWNGRHYLQRCLDSIAAQTHPNVEVVMVDNGSTDGSVAFVRGAYPAVIIVESRRNLGFAEGNNEAARHATGDYLFLLNNDAWLEPDTISELLCAAVAVPRAGIVGCQILNLDGSIQDIGLQIDVVGFPVGLVPAVHVEKDIVDNLFYVSGCALLIRADIFRELGGFDRRYFMFYEEVDLAWRAHLQGYTVVTAIRAVVHHVSGGSIVGGAPGKGSRYQTTTARIYLRERNTLATLLKNYSFGMLARVVPLYVCLNVLECVFFVLLLKPAVSWQYLRSYGWNVRQLPATSRARHVVQRNRRVPDRAIARYICPEIQKLRYVQRRGVPHVDA